MEFVWGGGKNAAGAFFGALKTETEKMKPNKTGMQRKSTFDDFFKFLLTPTTERATLQAHRTRTSVLLNPFPSPYITWVDLILAQQFGEREGLLLKRRVQRKSRFPLYFYHFLLFYHAIL